MPVVPLAAPGIAVPAFWFDMRDVRALTRARSRRHDFLTAILPVVQRIRWADKSPSARSPRCFRRRADGSTVRPAILPYRALARREPGAARSDRRPGERWSSFAISKGEHALPNFRALLVKRLANFRRNARARGPFTAWPIRKYRPASALARKRLPAQKKNWEL